MAGEQLAQAISRLRLHREAMADLSKEIAAQREQALAEPPASPADDEEGDQ